MYYVRLLLKFLFSCFSGRRKMAQCVIKDHFGHVTPNRFDMKMATKPGVNAGNTWSSE